jgi:dipeptidyl aminopeptidase/acylaminoacyl peptidase
MATATTGLLGKVEGSVTASPQEVYAAYLDRSQLVSGGAAAANWTRDGGLWLVEGAPDHTVILRLDLKSGKTAPMFDVAAVRAALSTATGRAPPGHGLPFDTFAPARDGRIEFDYAHSRWRMDPSAARLERLGHVDVGLKLGHGSASEAERLTPRMWKHNPFGGFLVDPTEVAELLSPSGEWFLSIQAENICLRATCDGREQRLTASGTPDRFWDIESPRIGLLKGRRDCAFHFANPWSPDSLTLLAYLRDVTGVFRIPRIHWLKPFEEVDFIPFQKAGARLDRVFPVFVDVRSGRELHVGLPQVEDRFIQLLGWHPDGTEALIIVYTRDMRQVEIFAADRSTGAVRVLMTERASTAVKIQHDAVFSGEHGFRMLADGSGFLWLSTRDGWNHLYHYDRNGQLIAQLTSGAWSVYEISHVGRDGFVYFTAAHDTARPYDLHVCRVSLTHRAVERLTRERGIHSATFAPGGEAFLDTHSSVDRPARTELVRCDGKSMRMLSRMDISRLQAVGYVPPEEFVVKAADGKTDIWGVMYKPFDFDPARRYPIVESIYGGPQMMIAQRYFAIDSIRHSNLPWALAHLGYITICLDARGTPGRSTEFHSVVYEDFTAGIADHVAAIRQLCERHPWMDATRVGITGHSWGGYFSTCALMQAPETYHAAVSSEPGYDPWHTILSEPYLDLPQKNRAAYERADVIRQAHRIRRPLMIITGTRYNPCTSNAFKMTRALIEARVDHELVVIPDATHGFIGAEEDYFLMKLTGWFDRHLQPGRGSR